MPTHSAPPPRSTSSTAQPLAAPDSTARVRQSDAPASETKAAAAKAPESREAKLEARLAQLAWEEKEAAADEREGKLLARQRTLQKAREDGREAILKAMRVETPEIDSRLFEEMAASALAQRGFTAAKDVTLLDMKGLEAKKAQEFFDLGAVAREDLLDRVGFYRGIVIDHRQTEPVQPGFRDVLRRPPLDPEKAARGKASKSAEPQTHVATVLYRKPRYAGNFDNSFTSSEIVHQSQKSGITNLSFSLAVAGGSVAKVGVGAGFDRHQRSDAKDASATKTLYITSNFYLPKVELSFDQLTPCASDAFVAKVSDALTAKGALEERFRRLQAVLDAFGHFVPTQTVVGGRLFATEQKTYKGEETGRDVTQRFAVAVKAMFSSVGASGELSAAHEKSEQSATKASSTEESQSLLFQAVGGEGGVLRDAKAWVESLFDYRRWSAVQRENLIPSIQLLPPTLAESCWEILRSYAQQHSKAKLLFEDNAFFLFYGDYAERAGKLARENYFQLCNVALGKVLGVSGDEPPAEQVMLDERGPYRQQLWYMSPDGHVSSSLLGHGRLGAAVPVEFSLTVLDGPREGRQVKLWERGRGQHQTWEYTASGHLICRSLGPDLVLAAELPESLVLRPRSEKLGELWSVLEGDFENATLRTVQPAALTSFQLRNRGSRLLLSVRDGELAKPFSAKQEARAVMLPDIGGAHQFWQMTAEGRIVAPCHETDAGRSRELLLSLDADGKSVCLSPADTKPYQRWRLTPEGYLATYGGGSPDVLTAGDKDKPSTQCFGLSMQPHQRHARQLWDVELARGQGSVPHTTALRELRCANSIQLGNPNRLFSMDGRPLKINGHLEGIQFRNYSRTGVATGYMLQLAALVRQEIHLNMWLAHDANSEDREIIMLRDGDLFADFNLLYLPPGPIAEIKLGRKPESNRVVLMYREQVGDAWVFADNAASDNHSTPLKNLNAWGDSVQVAMGKVVTAIGLFETSDKPGLGLRVIERGRPDMLVSDTKYAPEALLQSCNGLWKAGLDADKRLMVRGPGKEVCLWQPPAGVKPQPEWRLHANGHQLCIVGDTLPPNQRDPSTPSALVLHDDGTLVWYDIAAAVFQRRTALSEIELILPKG